MSACCPTCQRPFTADTTDGISRNGRFVSRNGLTARLTRTEGRVFDALHAAKGRIVGRADLMVAAYGLEGDNDPDWNIISVFVSKIRTKVAPLGIFIACEYNAGYALGVEK